MYRALLVCNAAYTGDSKYLPPLRGPRVDWQIMSKALTNPTAGMFQPEQVTTITDATTAELSVKAHHFFRDSQPDDVLFFYFSGHGASKNQKLFLCGVNTEFSFLAGTALSNTSINDIMSESLARAIIIILDCCHSGDFKGSLAATELGGKGRYVITATPPAQLADDAEKDGEASPFTQAFVDGLISGAMDLDCDGSITLEDLYDYLRSRAVGQPEPGRKFDGYGAVPIARRAIRQQEMSSEADPAGPVGVGFGLSGVASNGVVPFLERVADTAMVSSERLAKFRNDLREDVAREIPPESSSSDFLRRASLVKSGQLTITGVLLFGEEPTATVETAIVQCTHFHGITKEAPRDKIDLRGTIPEQIVQALDFIAGLTKAGNLPVEGYAAAQPYYLYPMIAVREIIANALVHRDYEHRETCVHVRLYQDRLEIVSPGTWIGDGLIEYEPVPISQLQSESRRRNFRLASILTWARLVEGEGSGLPSAVVDCMRIGAPEPLASQRNGIVTIVIYPRKSQTDSGRQIVFVSGENSLPVTTGDKSPISSFSVQQLRPIGQVAALGGPVGIPEQNASFTGRDTELAEVERALIASSTVVVQTVHGLGGIGKTALAAQYVLMHGGEYTQVVWITANDPRSIESGLRRFALALEPQLADALSSEALAERAIAWLASHDQWLVVLDDVESTSDIVPLLSRLGGGTGRFLTTTRRGTGWSRVGASMLRLHVLTPRQSLTLLAKTLGTTPEGLDGGIELCERLGFLPLAIVQAGAYIAQNQYRDPQSVRWYLGLLAESPAALFTLADEETSPDRTVARIWRITLDRLADTPLAGEILRVLAWFATDSIPRTLLDSLAPQLELDHALGRLSAYNLVVRTPSEAADPGSGPQLAVHRLVQAVTRTPDSRDPHRSLAAITAAHERATKLMKSALPEDPHEPGSWATWRRLIPHIDALAEHGLPDTDTLETAFILNQAGRFLHDQGALARATSYFHRVDNSRSGLLGEDHPDTLTARNNLARVLLEAGDLGRAVPLLEQALAGRLRVLGEDHPDTLTSRNDLAYAYESAGDLGRAVPLLEQALADRLRVLGEDHPDTLTTRSNLAHAFQAKGDLDRAISLYEETLAASQQILGDVHPLTKIVHANLYAALAAARRRSSA